MKFIVLDLTTATEEQIKATIECNARTAKLMTSEIEKLKAVSASAKKSKKVIVISEEQHKPEEEKAYVDETFEDEVDYYLRQLAELKKDELETKITSALPSRKHFQYERILIRLKLESIRAIKEIKDLLAEEGLELSDAQEFKEELETEIKKIDLIEKMLAPKEKSDEVDEEGLEPENKLIFIPTSGGNIRILEELDSIPIEYYERFLELFNSIKDGAFKNVKQFASNSELQYLCEVKDFKVRVIYARLGENCFGVISSFIKKSDNDKAYRNSIIRKYSDFLHMKDRLIENMSNPEFMALQEQYEQELFNKLSQGVPEKTPAVKLKVSTKGGE